MSIEKMQRVRSFLHVHVVSLNEDWTSLLNWRVSINNSWLGGRGMTWKTSNGLCLCCPYLLFTNFAITIHYIDHILGKAWYRMCIDFPKWIPTLLCILLYSKCKPALILNSVATQSTIYRMETRVLLSEQQSNSLSVSFSSKSLSDSSLSYDCSSIDCSKSSPSPSDLVSLLSQTIFSPLEVSFELVQVW